jgi:hypothetical protein
MDENRHVLPRLTTDAILSEGYNEEHEHHHELEKLRFGLSKKTHLPFMPIWLFSFVASFDLTVDDDMPTLGTSHLFEAAIQGIFISNSDCF